MTKQTRTHHATNGTHFQRVVKSVVAASAAAATAAVTSAAADEHGNTTAEYVTTIPDTHTAHARAQTER